MTLTVFTDVEQGSDEWLALRRGIVTASTVGKLISYGDRDPLEFECSACYAMPTDPCVSMAKGKTGPISKCHPARYEAARQAGPALVVGDVEPFALALAAERLTGRSEEVFVNNDMMRGTLAEPIARDIYGNSRSTPVEQIGFMLREEDGWSCGWSPDGLVGGRGAIEIKAPRAKSHLKTIIDDEVPAQHMGQCQAALLVSGRESLDFVSYYGGLALYVKPLQPDPAWFAAIELACRLVETAIQHVIATYTERAAGMPPTEPLDLYFEQEITAA